MERPLTRARLGTPVLVARGEVQRPASRVEQRSRRTGVVLATLLLIGLGPAAQIARAEDGQSVWTREKLLGDIGGLRPALGGHGVSMDLRLTQYYQSVADGGVETDDAYGGLVDYIVNVDGEKLGLWKGLIASAHVQTQFGNFDSLNGKSGAFALDNSALLYPLAGQSRTELTGWTIGQFLSKDVLVIGGKLNSIDLWTSIMPHTGGGFSAFSNTNLLAAALPWFRFVQLSEIGFGVEKLHPRGIQGAVLVFDPQNASTTSGFDNFFEDVAGIALWRFFFDVDEKPGELLFAFGGSTRSYGALEPSSFVIGSTPTTDLVVPGFKEKSRTGAWSVAGYYNQILWQAGAKGTRNIRFFTGVSFGPNSPGIASFAGFGTLEATGYFASRPKDKIGFGGFYTDLADDVTDTTQVLFGNAFERTSGIELYYNAELTPWSHLTGDLQLISSATPSTDTSVVPSVRLVVDF